MGGSVLLSSRFYKMASQAFYPALPFAVMDKQLLEKLNLSKTVNTFVNQNISTSLVISNPFIIQPPLCNYQFLVKSVICMHCNPPIAYSIPPYAIYSRCQLFCPHYF